MYSHGILPHHRHQIFVGARITPMMASILPHPLVDAANPGVEIVGAAASGGLKHNANLPGFSLDHAQYGLLAREHAR